VEKLKEFFMKNIFFKILFVNSFFFFSCSNYSCEKIPKKFESYKAAIEKIKRHSFCYSDSLKFFNGTYNDSASYYSCDGEKGFFIYQFNPPTDYEIVLVEVPLSVWIDFKKQSDKDSFVRENVIRKYKCISIFEIVKGNELENRVYPFDTLISRDSIFFPPDTIP
jgi:hypothetical protein